MLTRKRTLTVGAVLLALIGLSVAGGHVFAAQSGSAAADAAYQVFVAKLANNLGVTDPTKVDSAIRITLKQMVDDQLATGTISANKAKELKKKIDAADQPGKLLGLDEFAVKINPSTTTGNGGGDTGNGVDNHGGNASPDDDAGNGVVDNHGGNAGADDDAGNGADNHGGDASADDNGGEEAAGEDNHGGNAGVDDNGGDETVGGNSDDGNATGDDRGGDSGGDDGGDGGDGGDDHGGDSGNSGHGGDDD